MIIVKKIMKTFINVIVIFKCTESHPRCSISRKHLTRIRTTMIFCAWLTATVLIAFYRSSLIIALTSEARVPFEDLLQGLARWDWNPGARFNCLIKI